MEKTCFLRSNHSYLPSLLASSSLSLFVQMARNPRAAQTEYFSNAEDFSIQEGEFNTTNYGDPNRTLSGDQGPQTSYFPAAKGFTISGGIFNSINHAGPDPECLQPAKGTNHNGTTYTGQNAGTYGSAGGVPGSPPHQAVDPRRYQSVPILGQQPQSLPNVLPSQPQYAQQLSQDPNSTPEDDPSSILNSGYASNGIPTGPFHISGSGNTTTYAPNHSVSDSRTYNSGSTNTNVWGTMNQGMTGPGSAPPTSGGFPAEYQQFLAWKQQGGHVAPPPSQPLNDMGRSPPHHQFTGGPAPHSPPLPPQEPYLHASPQQAFHQQQAAAAYPSPPEDPQYPHRTYTQPLLNAHPSTRTNTVPIPNSAPPQQVVHAPSPSFGHAPEHAAVPQQQWQQGVAAPVTNPLPTPVNTPPPSQLHVPQSSQDDRRSYTSSIHGSMNGSTHGPGYSNAPGQDVPSSNPYPSTYLQPPTLGHSPFHASSPMNGLSVPTMSAQASQASTMNSTAAYSYVENNPHMLFPPGGTPNVSVPSFAPSAASVPAPQATTQAVPPTNVENPPGSTEGKKKKKKGSWFTRLLRKLGLKKSKQKDSTTGTQ
ncbi:hypothetical protein NP233_g7477 [Leucocoprinus birnbaumii]|uniref:Uncharacterized protein n=1 Tax=Leucocoprinus birnbaumii TaxID=56174 RepID=A0AAD5YUP9_9AGAR|nr:hypothetical protein NP233_g7477 [Leucocoprinus birnbaumii]